MKSDINIIFCSHDFNLKFVTVADNKLVEEDNHKTFSDMAKDSPVQLILPASAGLPFKLELPFGDKNKAERVIPQHVSDLYADVSGDWLFSWEIIDSHNNEKQLWTAFGLAFHPDFSIERLIPDFQCDLAIPDCILGNSIAKNTEAGNYSVKTKTPASESTALFTKDGVIKRIIGPDTGIPIEPILRNENVRHKFEIDFSEETGRLIESLNKFKLSQTNLDISGWKEKQKNTFLYLVKASSITLIAMLILTYHLFLWFETSLYEGAAQRTTAAITKAFKSVFPKQPVVEPVSQAKREISLIKSKLNKSSKIPSIEWQKFLDVVYNSTNSLIKIERIYAQTSSWEITAIASNYQSIDVFKSNISKAQFLSNIKVRDSRSISSGIFFTLEGKWND